MSYLMNNDLIKEIFLKYTNVAVVGISRNPLKESFRVANYLKHHGFQVIPINPFVDELLGEKCYKKLTDIPIPIQKSLEIVDIFRPSSEVLPIAKQVVKMLHEL